MIGINRETGDETMSDNQIDANDNFDEDIETEMEDDFLEEEIFDEYQPDDELDEIEFVDNPEPRCPVVIILDRSASMLGEPIKELNDGLKTFSETIKKDELAALRVEIAIVSFGPVKVLDVRENGKEIEADAGIAFATAGEFVPPELTAGGDTPMGGAVEIALQLLRDRKAIYKANGIDYFRPWMFLITDGYPTDGLKWKSAAEQVLEEESRKGLIFFGIGVQNADLRTLSKFSEQRPPAKLKGLAFGELFQWLSKSVTAVAQSKPGDQVPLPPVDWGQIDTSTS